ncbi:MAG: DUF5659 domain-containing protein [Patescibacteria group bacterium]
MTKPLKKGQPEEYQYIPLDDQTNYFYTFDLGCSAALISAGFELVLLDKANPRKVQFIFRREVGIEKVVDDYWADRLEVKARAFFDNVKMLKNRIYSE